MTEGLDDLVVKTVRGIEFERAQIPERGFPGNPTIMLLRGFAREKGVDMEALRSVFMTIKTQPDCDILGVYHLAAATHFDLRLRTENGL